MTIAILCPTRARPESFKRMVDSARNTAKNVGNLKFYVGLRDEDREVYTHDVLKHCSHRHIFPDGMPTSHKWNGLSEHAIIAGNRLFMLAADDMVFTTPHWDEALLNHYNELGNKVHVYSLRDSRDVGGTPHPIVTREWIDALGYFLPPIFLHWFVDSWTVEIAKANACFTYLYEYELLHDKPWDKGVADETFLFIRKMAWSNCDQWTNKHCQHFLTMEKKRLEKYFTSEDAKIFECSQHIDM